MCSARRRQRHTGLFSSRNNERHAGLFSERNPSLCAQPGRNREMQVNFQAETMRDTQVCFQNVTLVCVLSHIENERHAGLFSERNPSLCALPGGNRDTQVYFQVETMKDTQVYSQNVTLVYLLRQAETETRKSIFRQKQ